MVINPSQQGFIARSVQWQASAGTNCVSGVLSAHYLAQGPERSLGDWFCGSPIPPRHGTALLKQKLDHMDSEVLPTSSIL